MKTRAFAIMKTTFLLISCIGLLGLLTFVNAETASINSDGDTSGAFTKTPTGYSDTINIGISNAVVDNASHDGLDDGAKLTPHTTSVTVEGRGGVGATYKVTGHYTGEGEGTATWWGSVSDISWSGTLRVDDENDAGANVYATDTDKEEGDPVPSIICQVADDFLGDVTFQITESSPMPNVPFGITYKLSKPDGTTSSDLLTIGTNGTSPVVTLNDLDSGQYNLETEKACASNNDGKLPCYDRKIEISIYGVDIDVDSDNDGSLDCSADEDTVEDTSYKPGKVIQINDNDDDEDGIPDFADGYSKFGTPTTAGTTGESFTPVKITIPDDVDLDDAKIYITYSASDPDSVTRSGTAPYYTYTLPSGNLRLWKKNGSVARDKTSAISGSGDYIPSVSSSTGAYSPAKLGFAENTRTVTLYLEAIKPSSSMGSDQIVVHLDPDGSGETILSDTIRVTSMKIDIDVDSNNDGTIETDNFNEDLYETKTPGKIITIDDPLEVGTDASKSDVVQIKLNIEPEISGNLVLKMATGCTSALNIYEDINKTQALTLPKTWAVPCTRPSAVYACATTEGYPDLRLEWHPDGSSRSAVDDGITFRAIGPICRTPKVAVVRLWHSDSNFSRDGEQAIIDKVANNDWTLYCWYNDSNYDDDDVEDCTLSNLQACDASGIIQVMGHANSERICIAAFKTSAAAQAYAAAGNDSNLLYGAISSGTNNYYAVRAKAEWFASQWNTTLDAYQTIVIFAGCMTAYIDNAGNTSGNLMTLVGGRIRFGYTASSTISNQTHNNDLLFGNMTGEYSNGLYRTAKDAYGNGSNFQAGFVMSGNGWTTLAPAPILTNATFASPSPTSGKKGYAGILFDTYMDNNVSATSAVQCLEGSTKVSSRRWMASQMGAYGISFDYDQTTTCTIQMRAYAPNCLSTANGLSEKKLLGDRETYGSNRDWYLP